MFSQQWEPHFVRPQHPTARLFLNARTTSTMAHQLLLSRVKRTQFFRKPLRYANCPGGQPEITGKTLLKANDAADYKIFVFCCCCLFVCFLDEQSLDRPFVTIDTAHFAVSSSVHPAVHPSRLLHRSNDLCRLKIRWLRLCFCIGNL